MPPPNTSLAYDRLGAARTLSLKSFQLNFLSSTLDIVSQSNAGLRAYPVLYPFVSNTNKILGKKVFDVDVLVISLSLSTTFITGIGAEASGVALCRATVNDLSGGVAPEIFVTQRLTGSSLALGGVDPDQPVVDNNMLMHHVLRIPAGTTAGVVIQRSNYKAYPPPFLPHFEVGSAIQLMGSRQVPGNVSYYSVALIEYVRMADYQAVMNHYGL